MNLKLAVYEAARRGLLKETIVRYYKNKNVFLLNTLCFFLIKTVSINAVNINDNFDVSIQAKLAALKIIESSMVPNIESDKKFLRGAYFQSVDANFGLLFSPNTWGTAYLGINGYLTNQGAQTSNSNWQRTKRVADMVLDQAYIAIHPFDSLIFHPLLQLGLFEYQYNPYAVCFGEYLSHSGLYPGYLLPVDNFLHTTWQGKNILGARLGLRFPAIVSHDVVYKMEAFSYPYFDASLEYIVEIEPNPLFNLCAGVLFSRCFARNDTVTHVGMTYTKKDMSVDTIPYSGTKVMCLFGFDPFWLLKQRHLEGILRKKDLTLYAESAILGVKNYPEDIEGRGYPTIGERIPVTVGVNLPTHPLTGYGLFPVLGLTLLQTELNVKYRNPVIAYSLLSVCPALALFVLEQRFGADVRLDYFNVELEWYGSRYNNYVYASSLLPEFQYYNANRKTQWHNDDWRWAVSISKHFLNERIQIEGRIASDHLALSHLDTFTPANPLSGTFPLVSSSEWYWAFRLGFSF